MKDSVIMGIAWESGLHTSGVPALQPFCGGLFTWLIPLTDIPAICFHVESRRVRSPTPTWQVWLAPDAGGWLLFGGLIGQPIAPSGDLC